jgi:hypothetical protein
MSKANGRQVGGDHYSGEIQHWDFAAANNFDYFQGQVTKYVTRWKKKNGIKDLDKALHFLEKYIEVEKARMLAVEDTKKMDSRWPQYKASVTQVNKKHRVIIGQENPFGYDPDREGHIVEE